MAEHDQSYKQIFSHPEVVADLLTGFIDEPWIGELDLSTLERKSGSYVSDDLREREDDLIWRVRLGKERWLWVYLLLEFQSTVDRHMAVRILTYLGLLYQDILKSRELREGEKLPPVLPIVLYNGARQWKAPTEVSDLVEPSPEGLARFRPQLSYLLLDQMRYDDEELAAKQRNLVAAVFQLEKSRSPEQMAQLVEAVASWLDEPRQSSLRRTLVTWLRRVLLPHRFSERALEPVQTLEEVGTMLKERVEEWTREWVEQGREEGREVGREEGREEGRKHGRLVTLCEQLELKFGTVSEDVAARLQEASEEELRLWSNKILSATSLDELFQARGRRK